MLVGSHIGYSKKNAVGEDLYLLKLKLKWRNRTMGEFAQRKKG